VKGLTSFGLGLLAAEARAGEMALDAAEDWMAHVTGLAAAADPESRLRELLVGLFLWSDRQDVSLHDAFEQAESQLLALVEG
jgi:hypothetical protein